MQPFVDCVYCYLKQAANCMNIAGIDIDKQHMVLFDLMDSVKKLDRTKSPAENSTELLLEVYKAISNNDPYKEVKTESNDLALESYPKLKEYLADSPDRLYSALKIAVAGNVIDLGINKSFDIEDSLRHCLNTGFTRNDYNIFRKRLEDTDDVLVIGDNAGEIVFDKLLVEELIAAGKSVTYIVKGGPILNDATLEDAVRVGMDKITRVITTGSNYLGVPLDRISAEAREKILNTGVVISKGQANFETLEHDELAAGRVFFLLKIKCECVGKVAGAKLGDVVFFTR